MIESFCVAFFKKRPPIQRAERWSPSAEGEIPKPSIAPERVNFGNAERGETTSGVSPFFCRRGDHRVKSNIVNNLCKDMVYTF